MEDLLFELGTFHFPDEFWIVFRGAFLLGIGIFCGFFILAFIVSSIINLVTLIRKKGHKND